MHPIHVQCFILQEHPRDLLRRKSHTTSLFFFSLTTTWWWLVQRVIAYPFDGEEPLLERHRSDGAGVPRVQAPPESAQEGTLWTATAAAIFLVQVAKLDEQMDHTDVVEREEIEGGGGGGVGGGGGEKVGVKVFFETLGGIEDAEGVDGDAGL